MAQIVWTDPALSDLNDVSEYIALQNESAAKALVQRVFAKVERLADFPESGRIPPELEHLSYREVVVPPCRVFYKLEADQVLILFVMRAERDLRKFLLSNRKTPYKPNQPL
ncbi:type II toxin-antitoxin system RelE/ParE family toxin [Marinomonas fungiae]|uniref:Addiction module toxin, RelE/StbE family n=1 Tax=Marinomonas fungiae TaxID=1137284 RepID=A0A0K6IGQ8_9GAMM|nr:type II toxin-antitoxin system RelE/ParE family toxin [Marinomonas fungiae]CUB02273.1 addiction module toxin, RelE/StbE family [Marinomonas fungiae]